MGCINAYFALAAQCMILKGVGTVGRMYALITCITQPILTVKVSQNNLIFIREPNKAITLCFVFLNVSCFKIKLQDLIFPNVCTLELAMVVAHT